MAGRDEVDADVAEELVRVRAPVFVTHPRRPAREQPVVHELDERAGRERAELGRVELEAGRLALPPPHLVVGAEDAIAEEKAGQG